MQDSGKASIIPTRMPKSKSSKTNATVSQARARLRAGRAGDATTLLKKILARKPKNCEALELMAELCFRQGDNTTATRMLETVITAQPGNVPVLNKLAVVLATQSQFVRAADYLYRAVKLDPACLPAYLDLCKVNREMGLLDKSIEAGLNAVRLNADDPRAHSSLALSYERFGRHQQAHTHYQRAAELAPDDLQRQFACAVSHIGIGGKEAARTLLQGILARQPDHAQAHWMLARLDRCTAHSDKRLPQLEALLNRSDLPDNDRLYLHFALGKLYEDCAHYDTAFEHFAAGNRLENARYDYRPEHYRATVKALMRSWSCDFLAGLRDADSAGATPLFIVGLPRSGTTLVEQILAAHPEVYGAGELSWFSKTEQDLPAFLGSPRPYPACVAALKKEHIAELSAKYLAYLAALSDNGDYRYISDKMPSNYERIGLIAALFPRARIIHCRRDPLDNAVSQFCLLFQGNMEYSHDLYNLGTRYADYQRLMAHWHRCLPGQILDIEYEQLVADDETEIRRLLDFLDLPWDTACREFFNTRRAVRTSSDFQVRTPIYATSVGRWKHYEKFLAPLQQGLRDGAVE